MLEIKILVKIEGLNRLADALFAIAGAGNAGREEEVQETQQAAEVQADNIQETPEVPAGNIQTPGIHLANTQPEVPATVPVREPQPVAQTPAVPVTATAAPVNSQRQPQLAVPVGATTYSLDDLAHAAMALMDAGRQADLQGLLAKFGVESLPQLPPAHYGAFATGMREMGAQI